MKAVVAVLLFMSLALAGCGSKDSGSDAPAVEEPQGNSIRGVVVTPTIQPITGAVVTLSPGGAEDTTDLFGRFTFDQLEPGAYTVRAEAPDFESSVAQVNVVDGEISRPRIQLIPIRPPTPGHETLTFSGVIQAHFGAADDGLQDYKETLGIIPCDCDFFFSVPRGTVAITLEAYWEDSVKGPDPVPPPAYRYEVTPFTASHSASGAMPSPLLVVLTPESFEGEGQLNFDTVDAMRLRFAPDETWPTTDQTFEIFLTIWEVNPPPPGWSFVNGDR